MERRNLLQILGAGAVTGNPASAQHQHIDGVAAVSVVNYAPRALSQPEYQLVDRMAELIFPADEKSPGAHEGGVARYIDIVLLYGDKATLASWQGGLKSTDAAARKAHGSGFLQITPEQQTGILTGMARNEASPTTELEQFFVALKRLAMEAYYLSAAGRQSLGYKGNTAVTEFPGCTDHQA